MPRRRRWRIVAVVGALFALYLIALSAIPALLDRGGEDTAERRRRAQEALRTENWALVLPADREALARAIDDAWRALPAYRMHYVNGLPADLEAGRTEAESESVFRLANGGRIMAQHDTNFISSRSPGSAGRDERMEGYRLRTNQPYVNTKGHRVADAELIYRREVPGIWICERVAADKVPPPAPGLDLVAAGDVGFGEIDGQRVRAFTVPSGAFGLRSPATVWVELDTLRVRRQQIDASIEGRREVWTYGDFGASFQITPPSGVPCQDS